MSHELTALYERLSHDDELQGESNSNIGTIIVKDMSRLERELQNESRQHNRQQSRTKRREEEL